MYRLVAWVIGYLFGGVQSAILYGKLKGIDIKKHGSGNAGATNTLRVLGKKAGLIVFLCDFFKTVLAIIITTALYRDNALIVGLYTGIGAILGHSYPIFFRFKGGKGIAVSVGMLFALDFKIGCIAGIIFIITCAITKIVSISSLMMTASIPILIGIFNYHQTYRAEAIVLGCIAFGITLFRHRENIKRLINGTEAKITSKK
jgi:glycerol-3-phosphate acyltransferase PlsY